MPPNCDANSDSDSSERFLDLWSKIFMAAVAYGKRTIIIAIIAII
jgi:hypothetical protein